MHGLFIEKHSVELKALSNRLADQLLAHGPQGKIAIVTDHPQTLLASTRKQWYRLVRLTQRERADTLNMARTRLLEDRMGWMLQLRFTVKLQEDLANADVIFATADDLVHFASDWHTVIVTYRFEKEKLHMLTSWMPKRGTVILYEQHQ